ncbi:MAG: LssY C-terminal domain-containing protein [Verrucomicrobia bacterium]|nr:LssY C-terminal domain-containing protein [Verrucomicrobiota bacterium]
MQSSRLTNTGKKIRLSLVKSRLIYTFLSPLLLGLALVVAGCATTTFDAPPPFNDTVLRQGAHFVEEEGIRISATVPDHDESLNIFGVDLESIDVQPVWIEIENNTDRLVYFLETGLDPEYFSPLEVAFAFHKKFKKESKSQIDKQIESMSLNKTVSPHSKESGFVFTNVDQLSKFLNVDLISHKWANSFAVMVSTPESRLVSGDYNELLALMESQDYTYPEEESGLRELLEQLPEVALKKDGSDAAPLNVVIIGSLSDTNTAFIRRDYRIVHTSPFFVFGRPQDIALSKQDYWEESQPQMIRAWLTNIKFRDQLVWIAQVSMPLGGRFGGKQTPEKPYHMDSDVNEARIDLIQDLIYSQSLAKMGFVKGAKQTDIQAVPKTASDNGYSVDGLRAVLIFEEGPFSISNIEFLDWEDLSDYTAQN